MSKSCRGALAASLAALVAAGCGGPPAEARHSPPRLIVLGIAQDGGVPQAGSPQHPGWTDETRRRSVVSLGLVDPEDGGRWMFEATPDFKYQLNQLDRIAPRKDAAVLSGIFLTHAHIGHYLGLALLGHESMGTQGVPVYAMPHMVRFLSQNGPWDQLVRYGNISLRPLENGRSVPLNPRLKVTPIGVPHRQEYSEVVGYLIEGPDRAALFIPDIDSWEEWDRQGVSIEDWISRVEVAFLDGSFYADGEIPGRDMSGFPHPFITHSMKRFSSLSEEERAKIRFIHLNHTNPALLANSPERKRIEDAGFRVAREGETFEL